LKATFSALKDQDKISGVVWDYRKEFDEIDKYFKTSEHKECEDVCLQTNSLINVNSVKEYVDTSFEDSSLIKKRWKNIKRLRFIQNRMH
jgi:hypothetical protein